VHAIDRRISSRGGFASLAKFFKRKLKEFRNDLLGPLTVVDQLNAREITDGMNLGDSFIDLMEIESFMTGDSISVEEPTQSFAGHIAQDADLGLDSGGNEDVEVGSATRYPW
jgi:hypothetical protein